MTTAIIFCVCVQANTRKSAKIPRTDRGAKQQRSTKAKFTELAQPIHTRRTYSLLICMQTAACRACPNEKRYASCHYTCPKF